MLQRSQAPLLTQRGGRAVPGSPPPAGGPAPYRRPLRWSRAPPVPLLPRQAGEGRARSAPGARPPAPGGRSVGRVGRSAALPVPSRPAPSPGSGARPGGCSPRRPGAERRQRDGLRGGGAPKSPPREDGCYRGALKGQSRAEPPLHRGSPGNGGLRTLLSACGSFWRMGLGEPS